MNILGIQAFSTIVETGSISQAAKLLYVSQSTVSNRLIQLENELNTTLIIRNKGLRTIHLTPMGEEFIAIAERWLSLWNDTTNLQNAKLNIPLAIGCTDSLNTYVFPELYKSMLDITPYLDLHVRTHHSLEIYQLLSNHEIDAGFIITPFAYKNINIESVFSEKMVLICKPDHFTPGKIIHPSELDCRKEVFTDWSPEINKWHNFWFNTSNRPRANFNNPSLILFFIESCDYWAIVPYSLALAFSKTSNIQIHLLTDPPANRESYLITHQYPKPSRVENLELLRRSLKTFSDHKRTLFE